MTMFWRKILLLGFSLTTLFPVICLPQTDSSLRPKIGLVLSGGGARGAAHVGVIKVLDELRIPIDYIAGTSMGAIVGGLYASGMSAKELENIIGESDWTALLSDRPPRAQRSFRRKNDDFGFLVNLDLGVSKDGLRLPRGLVHGQNLTLALRKALLPVATIRDFDQLPIPFRAIATDIASGEEVILSTGDLSRSIRASMSAPGVFDPIQIDGQTLVDGGVVNNLPINIVKSMGADILIVVDVGSPLADETELGSALAVTGQMLTILIKAQSEQQKRFMGVNDLLIAPKLGRLSTQAFDQAARAIVIGESTARESLTKLGTLSVSQADYSAHRLALQIQRSGNIRIDKVIVDNNSRISTKYIESQISDLVGETLSIEKIEAKIDAISRLDLFESVDYSIVEDDSDSTLMLSSKRKEWGPNFLRFGVNLEDDFNGASNYNLATRFTMTELNDKGGEFRADLVLGESPGLALELYQPLDDQLNWFVNPKIEYRTAINGLFVDQKQIAQFRSKEIGLSLEGGRNLSDWGEVRGFLARQSNDADIEIGDPTLGGSSSYLTSFGIRFAYDTLDRLAVPRYGTNFDLTWLGVREGFGSPETADLASLSFLRPYTFGKNTFLHWWEFGSVINAGESALSPFALGGLFSLSGYAPDELTGQHAGIGRLLYYRRLGDGTMPILDTPLYIGFSLEAGNVWQDSNDISISNTLTAGSAFVIIDTLIGPLYLAYGAAEGDRRSAYLFLGQTF